LFLFLAAFDVGIFALQSQSSVILWSFSGFLDEAVEKNDFALVNEK